MESYVPFHTSDGCLCASATATYLFSQIITKLYNISHVFYTKTILTDHSLVVNRGKWSLIGKNAQFCSKSIHDYTDSTYVIKFHGYRPLGSGWNNALFWWQTSLQYVLFCYHFVAIWQKVPNIWRGPCHLTLHLPVKFCLNQFWFAGVISKKVISYDHICV